MSSLAALVRPAFVVRVVGGGPGVATSLTTALLDFPVATDDEVARLKVPGPDEEAERAADAVVLVVSEAPTVDLRARLTEIAGAGPAALVAIHAPGVEGEAAEALRAAWAGELDPSRVRWTSGATPAVVAADELRAGLLLLALGTVDVPIARARRAKRPYATAIIAAGALAAGAEGLLPGAAAFVVATQVGAIASLYYLYTGRMLARTQALALLPAFAAEAAGGSLFLFAKSFLPPTGVADAVAAAVAASMTVSILGAIAWALEQGYSLEEKRQLVLAFKRMNSLTRGERARIDASRHRWNDKAFWADVVRRVVFDG